MASNFIKQIVNRGAVVNKCGSCNNRTTNPTGFCYLHENDAKNAFASKKSSGKLEDASLALFKGKTAISTVEDHTINDGRNLTSYMKDLEADLTNSLALGHPIFMHGPPGVGKSAIVENFAAQFGAHLETVIGGQMTPTDIAGLPYSLGIDPETGESGGTATDSPEWGKRLIKECKDNPDGTPGKPGVLFFDELTNTDRQTQAAMLRLINERVFPNGDKLPQSVAIFAAGNVGDDAVVTEGLGGAMKNRFSIRGCHPPVADFVEGMATGWGNENMSDGERQSRLLVASFLTKFPDRAYDAEGSKSDDDTQSFATYRSWDKLAGALGRGEFMSESHVRGTMDAYIGKETSQDFYSYINGLDLPDPADVIKNPKIVDWDNIDSDKAFAIMLSVRQGGSVEKDPIGAIKLYAHVAQTRSQHYAASTLGGFAKKARDSWLKKGGYTMSDRPTYQKDPTYKDYMESFVELSEHFKSVLEDAGLNDTNG